MDIGSPVMLRQAIAIALKAHHDQVDKAGKLYLEHPLHLMMQAVRPSDKIVAVLHDVVEDSHKWTIERLRCEEFPTEVVDAIEAMTKRPKEPYSEYIERVAANPIAKAVKILDLEHNMDVRRLPSLGDYELTRLRKYHNAWQYLTGRKPRLGD